MNNHKDTIKQMYENIHTPEYDVKDAVLNDINKQKTIPTINRKVLLVAVMVFILLVGTAGVAGAFDHIFTMSDPIEPEYGPVPTPTPTVPPTNPSEIDIPYEDVGYIIAQFTWEVEYGEYRIAYALDNDGGGQAGHAVSPVETQDYSVLLDAIEKSKIPIALPAYISDGYTFSDGSVDYFLDNSIANTEPKQSWEQDGINYLIYQLPDGFDENILRCFIDYQDAQGNDIRIHYELANASWGMYDFHIGDEQTGEYVEINGYEDAILIHNTSEDNRGHQYTLALYSIIDPVEEYEFTAYLLDKALGHSKSEKDFTTVYDAMITYIYVDTLTEIQLIEFAEGLVNE